MAPLTDAAEKEFLPKPLSHSAVHTYLDCPQKWKLKYVDKLPEKPRHFFSFGKSLHEALEFLYGVKTLPPPSLDEVLKAYYEHWYSEGYASLQQEEQYRAEGVRILKEYYRKNIPGFQLPLFVEYEFKFHLKHEPRAGIVDGAAEFDLDIARRPHRVRLEPRWLAPVPLIGYVDRIDKTEGGQLDVVDYKTGKAFDLERVRGDSQLTMYQLACEAQLGLPIGTLTLYHLPTQTPFSVGRREDAQVEALKDRLLAVAGLIRRGMAKLKQAPPVKGDQLDLLSQPAVRGEAEAADFVEEFAPKVEETKCGWCDFKPYCPAWKHLFAKKADPERAPGLKSDKELSKLVDQYGKLKDEAHALETQAEDLKKKIVETLHLKKYARAFGSQYEVSVHEEEKWDFPDKQKILDAIQRAGYWDRILAPSSPLVQKLMGDPNLPLELRERFAKLGHKTQHAVLRMKKTEGEE
ncbi:MAG TPA: hypothetical protein DCM05_04915 [Elusimicrobia bacterium]|nr:hypothetical protein [Elusimicrobiota bacterium]